MTKRTIIRCILALIMLAYLAVILPTIWRAVANDRFKGLIIEVDDPANMGFVKEDDINRELGDLNKTIKTTMRSALSTAKIEEKLNRLDKVERAECMVLSDGTLKITVKPMRPVARLIDPTGKKPSYYINREGKYMLADLRYRMDVPIISGGFGPNLHPADIMPLLDYIDRNPQISDLVSSISINPAGDIIIVPAISGHVINLGDTSILADKWRRVITFYHKVMPQKGWDYYDTLSVKWRGQLVATMHKLPEAPPPVPLIDDGSQEIDDASTIETNPSNPSDNNQTP